MDKFTAAYIEAALWSSTDENDRPLDGGDYELSVEARTKMESDCAQFQAEFGELLTAENCPRASGECTIDELARP